MFLILFHTELFQQLLFDIGFVLYDAQEMANFHKKSVQAI